MYTFIALCLCREWQRQIDRISTGRRVGMLWLDLSECLAALRATLSAALATLCGVLEIVAHSQLSTALAQVQVCLLGDLLLLLLSCGPGAPAVEHKPSLT